MTRRASLNRRLTLGLAASIGAAWLAASLVAGLVLSREIDEVFDGVLREVAERVLPLAYAELVARDDDQTVQNVVPLSAHGDNVSYVVRDASGKVLLQSSDAGRRRIPLDLTPGYHSTERLRTYTEVAVRGTIVVTTAEDLDHRRAATFKAIAALMWPLIALIPLAVAGVWLTLKLTLAPLNAFRRAIEARGEGHLVPIAVRNLPAEMLPVAASVNGLIARLRAAIAAEREFTANSAHELRTPIAAALAHTQRLIAELDQDPRRERARTVETALRRLARLAEKLLDLAKAEGAALYADVPSPLGPVLALVVDDLDRQHDCGDRLAVAVTPDDGPVSRLDPDAFAILARNLIENALRHGDPEEPITIRLDDRGFEVANAGPVLAPEDVARLTRPFERAATSAEGSGLGLAIVAAICRGAHLELTLASPRPGHADGFQATVNWTGGIAAGAAKLPEA
ncbi:MAG: histidine kinase dimerization/phospho-acceptor domain-containing protein [Ancalomicrobiaceae bacterium]|nr:histidine kinase dimerization/phospho-acceptor domain-containing protein [Ancalomicrobiaceae bacterium]